MLIEDIVLPNSWTANHGAGDMMEFYEFKLLAVRQTDAVHEEIERLFAELRAKNTEQKKTKPVSSPPKRRLSSRR